MASKGLIAEAIDDCVEASTINAPPLENEERILCERLLRFPYFWFSYAEEAPAFWRGVRALLKTTVGREILMLYCIALVHQAKWHDDRVSQRVRHVAMSLRILAECCVLGWRFGG